MRGARSLLQTVPVDWVASSLSTDHALLAQRANEGGVALRCETGQRWEWDGVRFAIIHPSASHYEDTKRKTNDESKSSENAGCDKHRNDGQGYEKDS